jgi:iron complex transport system substrate-binding protein
VIWRIFVCALVALAGCARDDAAPAGSPGPGSAGAPERIISLTPSTTEIVAAAGGLDRLVGVDRYSRHPPEVKNLARVGDFLNPSFEAIVRLEPDLVILDDVQRKVDAGLRSAGIDTLVLRMHTLDDVREGLRRVGQRLDTEERAQASIARIDDAVREVEKRAEARDERPSVLLVVDRQLGGLGDLVAATSGSFLDELLAIAGAENAFAAAGARYAKISPEAVVRAAPDVIIETSHADDLERARSDWDELRDVPAVERGRVHLVGEGYYTAPGPRAAQAVLGLDALVYENNLGGASIPTGPDTRGDETPP